MKSSKNVLYYAVYMVLGYLLLRYGGMGLNALKERAMNFDFNLYYYVIAFKGFYFLVGMFFGIPSLMQKRKQSGTWQINLPMFCTLFLPSFILLLCAYSLYWTGGRVFTFLLFFVIQEPFATLLPLFSGLMLIQSMEKRISE